MKLRVLTLQACVARGFDHVRLVKGMLKGVAVPAENVAGSHNRYLATNNYSTVYSGLFSLGTNFPNLMVNLSFSRNFPDLKIPDQNN